MWTQVPGQLTTLLGAAVQEANRQLAERVRAAPGLGSMGSTLTAMSSTALTAHVVLNYDAECSSKPVPYKNLRPFRTVS